MFLDSGIPLSWSCNSSVRDQAVHPCESFTGQERDNSVAQVNHTYTFVIILLFVFIWCIINIIINLYTELITRSDLTGKLYIKNIMTWQRIPSHRSIKSQGPGRAPRHINVGLRRWAWHLYTLREIVVRHFTRGSGVMAIILTCPPVLYYLAR